MDGGQGGTYGSGVDLKRVKIKQKKRKVTCLLDGDRVERSKKPGVGEGSLQEGVRAT